ncbi:Hypothetical protein LLA12_01169 [Lactococcus lactis subsp. lactis]|nr:Hypothetical protein LLA12_01169 [Lactococcus lactis subsp. lactis]
MHLHPLSLFGFFRGLMSV